MIRIRYLFLPGIAAVALGPLVWLAVSAFKHRVDLLDWSPKLFFVPTLANFHSAFVEHGFGSNAAHSAIVALTSSCLALALAIPAAFALSRRPGRGRLLFLVLSVRMAPAPALALPLFLVFRYLGLLDTPLAPILAHGAVNTGFAVWMLKGFFDELPASFGESAEVDGLSSLTTARLATRAILPGILAVGIFCVLFSWNEFFLAMVLTGRRAATLPVAILGLVTPAGTSWGEVAAIATVTVLPAVFMVLLVRRLLVRGLTFGGFRGSA
jgi:multiple sugar transport system permease protein